MKRYRKPEKGGGLFSAIEHQQAVARETTGILSSCSKSSSCRNSTVSATARLKRKSSTAAASKPSYGLQIGDDIPDAKTLWDFKQRIEEDGQSHAQPSTEFVLR